MSRFSKFKVGDKASITHQITQEDIDKFVSLSGDNNKIHVDNDFASKTTFKKTVAHGMIGASFISTIIGTKIPGDGALWYSQNIEFLLPVRVGDTLKISAEIIKKIPKLNAIELKTSILNQYKKIVTTGIAKVKIIEDSPKSFLKEENNLLDKSVLILGSTGGIGSALAKKLVKDGYSIILHYNNNKQKAVNLKKELSKKTDKKITLVKANLIDPKNIASMFNEIERDFDSLTSFVNASMLDLGNIKFNVMDWSDISKQIDINVKSSFLVMKYIIPLMKKNNYGKVVFISTQATETFSSEWLHYTTAKSALNGFAKSLAIELAPLGVRVNLVSPGMTDTELVSNIPEKIKLITAAKTPLKKLATPDDVAEAIAYLISPKSDFITGETIRVNGGQIML